MRAESVEIEHLVTGGKSTVTRAAYVQTWRALGWRTADEMSQDPEGTGEADVSARTAESFPGPMPETDSYLTPDLDWPEREDVS